MASFDYDVVIIGSVCEGRERDRVDADMRALAFRYAPSAPLCQRPVRRSPSRNQ